MVGRALASTRHLAAFLPEFSSLVRKPSPRTQAVLGPAEGSEALRADAIAQRLGLPRWTVRDGPLRSIGAPESGAAPVSLFAEPTTHSVIASLLGSMDWATPEMLAEARELITAKRAAGLSRISGGIRFDMPDAGRRPTILIAGGRSALVRAVRTGHPDARLIQWGVAVSEADLCAPAGADLMHLIEQADTVAVDDSPVGLDALLCGKPVICFGRPFYAGRGLTDDRGSPLAAAACSLEAIFAAAYMLAPRYVDPLTGQACSARTAIERLAAFKHHADRVRGAWTGLNIPPAKYGVMRAFLTGPQSSFTPHGAPGPERPVRYANWASRPNGRVRRTLQTAPDQVVNIEDGFIRSVGLGSSFHPASSLVLDSRGIYYDPTWPSDLEHLLGSTTFDAGLLARAAALRQAVVALGLSKYNLPQEGTPPLPRPDGRRSILVPGQVEDDASVLTGGAGLSNLGLLEQVRRDNPDARILYKEHPDVTSGNRRGRVPGERLQALRAEAVRGVDVLACIAAVDEVHTLTSLTGFEALLRGKPVTAYGRPFYAGWGLTTDRDPKDWPGRGRRLVLDELVAGALILYPLYLDPVTWLPCDAATFVDRLGQMREASPAPKPRGRFLRIGQGLRTTLWPRRPPPY